MTTDLTRPADNPLAIIKTHYGEAGGLNSRRQFGDFNDGRTQSKASEKTGTP